MKVHYEIINETSDESITAYCADENVAKVTDIKVSGNHACISVQCVGSGSTDIIFGW